MAKPKEVVVDDPTETGWVLVVGDQKLVFLPHEARLVQLTKRGLVAIENEEKLLPQYVLSQEELAIPKLEVQRGQLVALLRAAGVEAEKQADLVPTLRRFMDLFLILDKELSKDQGALPEQWLPHIQKSLAYQAQIRQLAVSLDTIVDYEGELATICFDVLCAAIVGSPPVLVSAQNYPDHAGEWHHALETLDQTAVHVYPFVQPQDPGEDLVLRVTLGAAMGKTADRLARLTELQTAVEQWATARTGKLQASSARAKAILKGRTGSERLPAKAVGAASGLVVNEITDFLATLGATRT